MPKKADLIMEIEAKLEYIIYENHASNYLVGSFSETETYHLFTGAGRLKDPQEDQTYILHGDYVKHPKYGTQFQIQGAQKVLPKQKNAIIHFLSGNQFPTIGKKSAELIYETLGETCLEQIKEDPSCLDEIDKLNASKKQIIYQGIQSFEGFNPTYVQLMKWGLSDHKIRLLEETYDNVLETLEKNCFAPYYEIYGFGYKTSLKLADGLQLKSDDPRRFDAYIYETCRQLAMATGNTYLSLPALVQTSKCHDTNLIMASLLRLQDQKNIYIDEEKIYPYSLYEDEITIAKQLAIHTFKVDPISKTELQQKIQEVEFAYAITYDIVQKEAISLFFEHSCMILNGGPGTGKTTTVKGILEILKTFWPDANVQLCAPTGRASKRLAQSAMADCRTIHSLLKWNKDDNSFGKNEEEPLDCQFLIVDEFSMVDTHLFAQLLKALPDACRILLIGDEDQLESVGPGKVFHDLLESECMPSVHLEKIYRQSEGSGIITLAKEIRDEQECHFENDVTFLEVPSSQIITQLQEMIDDQDQQQFQVLAPMYKGIAGIDAINLALQNQLNPYSESLNQYKVGTTIFRQNDKVMLLKNLPDEDVYNGDIGTILDIHTENKTTVITVDFQDHIVDFTNDFLYYLSHAYCISVHKSQGSEYDCVYCIIDAYASQMLNKRLIYTAISRAKKKLVILGNLQTFRNQVRIKNKRIRQTTLKQRILDYQR